MPAKGPISTFADIVLPLPHNNHTFTYQVPPCYLQQNIVGHRAVVPFQHQLLVGIIWRVHTKVPAHATKILYAIPDREPLLEETQRNYFDWLATYYCCGLGELIQVALGGIKPLLTPMLELPTMVAKTDYPIVLAPLWELLHRKKAISWKEATQCIPARRLLQHLPKICTNKLLECTAPLAYNPAPCPHVQILAKFCSPTARTGLLGSLRATRQKEALTVYFDLLRHKEVLRPTWIPIATLLQHGARRHAIEALIQKNVFSKQICSRSFIETSWTRPRLPQLTTEEEERYTKIRDAFNVQKVVLVTGDTIIEGASCYQKIILETLQQGGQVLCLVPDKKTRPPFSNELQQWLGDQACYYGNNLAPHVLHARWEGIKRNQFRYIIGTSSALFLPFAKLRLVLVWQEDRYGHTQNPSIPFHRRDAAIMLAKQQGAHALLVATLPSVESYYNAIQKKYRHVAWPSSPLPKEVLHIVKAPSSSLATTSPPLLCSPVINAVKKALHQQQQVVLLTHRKGYASYHTCRACTWIARCPTCHISLTFHQTTQQLRCHYCPYYTSPHTQCPVCQHEQLRQHGHGTEQLAEFMALYFPTTSLDRLDGSSSPRDYTKKLASFLAGETSLLIGTPHLIEKLFPTGKGTLVIIPAIEQWLHIPSFRAQATCYQWLHQLTRRSPNGVYDQVLLQTHRASHQVLWSMVDDLQQQDIAHQYATILHDRHENGYPPFQKLWHITLQHRQVLILQKATQQLYAHLQQGIPYTMLSPQPVRRLYAKAPFQTTMGIKIPTTAINNAQKKLVGLLATFRKKTAWQGLSIRISVDHY